MKGPLLVTIEGPQGSGKSTLAREIAFICARNRNSIRIQEETHVAGNLQNLNVDVLVICKQTK